MNKNNIMAVVLLSSHIILQGMLGSKISQQTGRSARRYFGSTKPQQLSHDELIKNSWGNRVRALFSPSFKTARRRALKQEELNKANEMIEADNSNLKAWGETQSPSYHAKLAEILHSKPNEPNILKLNPTQSGWSKFKAWIWGK